MNRVCSLFSQILQNIPRLEFQSIVQKHKAERHARGFSCWEQLVAMLFCQLGRAHSLREICGGLATCEGKLRHLGLNDAPCRSTLAYANEHRPWEVYRDLFFSLRERCSQEASGRGHGFRFKNKLVSMDASTMALPLSLFDWAHFQRTKGAVKLHLILDHDGYLPSYAVITTGKKHEITVARQMHFEAGAIVVFDKGYADYLWWRGLDQKGVHFVSRLRNDAKYRVEHQREIPPTHEHLCKDEDIVLEGWRPLGKEGLKLRRIEVWLENKQEMLVLVTNHPRLAASTIAAVYRDRWRIGVSRKGHMVQSVRDRPRLKDSSLVAGEAPWRESKTAEPSDNMLGKECAQRIRLQRAVNVEVASLHEFPVAETVDNARKQQEPTGTSPMRRFSPAGYQRRHDAKDDVETGEALDARRRKLAEEMPAITAIGKCRHRHQGGGSGRSTVDGRAAKRVRREGPGPVSTPSVKARRG